MAFLTLAQAKAHLRVDGSDEDADLTLKIAAAERAATEYLQCNVYADAPALATAIADTDLSLMEQAQAMSVYMRAVYEATRTRHGVVINELIQSAMLLILGWLHESREDGTEIPRAAQDLLNPFRCYA